MSFLRWTTATLCVVALLWWASVMPASATSVAGVLVYPASVAENVPVGATVGTLSAPPGGAYTYTLVAGPGDTDNGAFTIDGNQLMLTVSPNYEVKNSYALRVQASDGTNTYASPLTVTITNVAEAPVAVDGDVAATSWDATAVPLELPDGADLSGTRGTWVTATQTVSGLPIVGTLTLDLWLETTFRNDLRVSLEAPDGTTVMLLQNEDGGGDHFGGGAAMHLRMHLRDDAPTSITNILSSTNTTGQSYRPRNPLSAFRGKNGNGTWALHLIDDYSQDRATLRNWALTNTPSPIEDTPFTVAAPGVLGNDTDEDGNTLTAVLYDQPQHGTVTLNANGGFTYTPAVNYNGPDSFTYRAFDGGLYSDATAVAFTVVAVNDAPVMDPVEDVLLDVDAGPQTLIFTGFGPGGGADEAGQTLNVDAQATNETLFSVLDGDYAGQTAVVTFTPSAGQSGTSRITFDLVDSAGATATYSFLVRIYPRQPDVRVQAARGSVIGDDLYEADGASQSATTSLISGRATYTFSIQNDGGDSDRFRVVGFGAQPGWTVRYYSPTLENITAAMTGTGWTTPVVAPGATVDIQAQVTWNGGAPTAARTLRVTAASVTNPAKRDAALAITRVLPREQPDLWLRLPREATYQGIGVYNATGAGQARAAAATPTAPGVFLLSVQNVSAAARAITLTGPADASGWTRRYFLLDGVTEITTAVTTTGWSTGTLASLGVANLLLKVTPTAGVTPGTVLTTLVQAAYADAPTKLDVVKAVATR